MMEFFFQRVGEEGSLSSSLLTTWADCFVRCCWSKLRFVSTLSNRISEYSVHEVFPMVLLQAPRSVPAACVVYGNGPKRSSLGVKRSGYRFLFVCGSVRLFPPRFSFL